MHGGFFVFSPLVEPTSMNSTSSWLLKIHCHHARSKEGKINNQHHKKESNALFHGYLSCEPLGFGGLCVGSLFFSRYGK